MAKYLVGHHDDFSDLMIVTANSEQEAKDLYSNFIQPDENFLENLHGWNTNASFSAKFHYDEKSKGQENLSVPIINQRIHLYFSDKPEYEKIYLAHWYAESGSDDHQMKDFPNVMIQWIWRKELESGNWTSFKAINLDEVEVLKS